MLNAGVFVLGLTLALSLSRFATASSAGNGT